MPAATCAHGFAPGECLICATLARTAAPAPLGAAAPVRVPAGRPAPTPTQGGPPVRPARVSRAVSVRVRVAGAIIFAVVAVLVAAWVWTIVRSAIHALELVGVAAISGWAGWRLGVHHGRHIRD